MQPIPLNWERLLSFLPGIFSMILKAVRINFPVYRTFNAACRVVLPKDMPKDDLERIWRQMRWESLPFLQALSGLRKKEKPPTVDFKNLSCKIRIVGCKHDRLVPLEVIKEYGVKIPGSECCILDSAHYPFWGEEGDKLNNLLLDFVSA
jgi:pimeloyl-ACP methyl ester carboxylesterase